jgi:hypothetical protein
MGSAPDFRRLLRLAGVLLLLGVFVGAMVGGDQVERLATASENE